MAYILNQSKVLFVTLELIGMVLECKTWLLMFFGIWHFKMILKIENVHTEINSREIYYGVEFHFKIYTIFESLLII